jgi:translation initiation factor 1A
MPNLRGGKAYKKGKKKPAVAEVGGDSGGGKFSGREDGQDYGRVLRLLGDRRAMCFCNDGAERIGKFRGAICRGPKKQKIEVGDLVIVSARDCDESGVVDILEKIPRTSWRHVRKEAGIHKHLLGDGDAGEDDLFEDDNTMQNNGGAESDDSLDIDDI